MSSSTSTVSDSDSDPTPFLSSIGAVKEVQRQSSLDRQCFITPIVNDGSHEVSVLEDLDTTEIVKSFLLPEKDASVLLKNITLIRFMVYKHPVSSSSSSSSSSFVITEQTTDKDTEAYDIQDIESKKEIEKYSFQQGRYTALGYLLFNPESYGYCGEYNFITHWKMFFTHPLLKLCMVKKLKTLNTHSTIWLPRDPTPFTDPDVYATLCHNITSLFSIGLDELEWHEELVKRQKEGTEDDTEDDTPIYGVGRTVERVFHYMETKLTWSKEFIKLLDEPIQKKAILVARHIEYLNFSAYEREKRKAAGVGQWWKYVKSNPSCNQ